MTFNPPEWRDPIPEDLLKLRLKLIQEAEGSNHSEYKDLTGYCACCQRRLWVGREKDRTIDGFYLFDDYNRIHDLELREYRPLCFQCKDKCYCKDKQYKFGTDICIMCEERKCIEHDNMHQLSKLCNECYDTFMLGKKIIQILKEKKPTTLEQLYSFI